MDLFEYNRSLQGGKDAPLAARMRPVTLEEFVGQEHIVGKGKLLYRAIKSDRLSSVIFYGPPGTGKTTLAKIIANTGAYCTEMEGAAIAHTAWKNGIPFVILRAISDKADDSAEMDYPTFEAAAADRCAKVTRAMARRLA